MSAKPVLEISIGDNVFYVRRFEPFLALEILGDLQKQFASPVLMSLDGKETPRNENGEIVLNTESTNRLMSSFANLSSNIDGKTLRKIAETLIDKDYVSVSIDGAAPRKLDLSAQGLSLNSVADIFELCWGILKHNYSEVMERLSNPFIVGRLLNK